MEPALRRLSPKRRDMHPPMMDILTGFNLDEALALLIRTPATLSALLRGLPDPWVRRNEEGIHGARSTSWGHLIVGERTDWIPRLRIILEKGEARQFDPVDRLAQFEESQGKSLDQLLDDFARLRRENLAALQTLNLQHETGAARKTSIARSGDAVGTRGAWAVHDLTHIHQLSRVMAHQYRNAVGPWSAYLGGAAVCWS